MEAGRVLGAAIALPAAVGSVAEGVGAVEVGIEPCHVDEAGIVRAHGTGRIDDLVRGIGRRCLPGGHVASCEQNLGAEVPAALRVPGGLGEPLSTAGVLDQVVEGRVLEAAQRTVGTADPAADPFAVRVADSGGAGKRIEDRGSSGSRPAAAGVLGVGPDGPVAVAKPDRAAPRDADRTDGVAPAARERPAAEKADLSVAVRTVDHAVLALEGQAVEVAARDHVHHAGDRVRAVRCRAAVTQELDLLDRDHRQHVRVHHQLRLVRDRPRGPGDPVAVQQDQGPAGSESAQVECRAVRARSRPELVGLEIRAEAEREVADHAEHGR